jgi:hypothetical protein
MDTKQKTAYVVQIIAAMVAHSGNPGGLESRVREVIRLVEKIEAEVDGRDD